MITIRKIFYFWLLLWSTYAFSENVPVTLSYSIDYLQQTITLEFVGTETGNTIIILPNEQYGNKELYKQISNIQVSGASLKPTQYEFAKVLQHAPNAKLTVTYNFSIAEKKIPTNLNQARMPLLQKTYFHFIGGTLLITPQLLAETNIICKMQWSLPASWSFASSFRAYNLQQTHIGSMSDLVNALFIGGDFRINLKKINNQDVCIALRDSWQFTDGALADEVVKIIATARDFWRDNSFPFFLVSAIPIYQQENIISGLGLHHAFCLFVAENQVLNANLKRLLVHEYFHTWNTPKIFTNNANDQIEYLWFTEGFTDYYMELLALRAGCISLTEYIQDFNKTLLEYYTSSAMHIANAKIKYNFWQSYDVNKISYQRGYLLAHNWNTNIKRNTANTSGKSLDDAMRDILKKHNNTDKKSSSQLNTADGKQTTLSIADITAIINNYTDRDIYTDFERYVEAGDTIVPDPHALGECATHSLSYIAVPDPEFDLRTSAMLGKTTDIASNTAPYSAGLRTGQNIVEISYNILDVNTPIIIRIEDLSGVKTIKYLSKKSQTISVPQFQLNQDLVLQNPGLCLAWFGKITRDL